MPIYFTTCDVVCSLPRPLNNAAFELAAQGWYIKLNYLTCITGVNLFITNSMKCFNSGTTQSPDPHRMASLYYSLPHNLLNFMPVVIYFYVAT